MPDPLRVSLAEVDRRWSYIRAGKEYHGEAVNPWNLSIFERLIGHHKTYNRAKDEEDRYPHCCLGSMWVCSGEATPEDGVPAVRRVSVCQWPPKSSQILKRRCMALA